MPLPGGPDENLVRQDKFDELDKRLTQVEGSALFGLGHLKVICGTVNTTTPTSSGAGFSVSKNATGDVTITFTAAFSSAPYVSATSTQLHTNLDAAPSASSVRIQTWDSTNTKTNSTLCFIAIGPA